MRLHGRLGAESSLVAERDRSAISRSGGFNGNAVVGIGGRMEAIGGGLLDFVFPGRRVKPLDPKAVLQWANTAPSLRKVGMVCMDEAPPLVMAHSATAEEDGGSLEEGAGAESTGVYRRPAHGPLVTAQELADRLKIFEPQQLREYGEMVSVKPGPVADSRDYSVGLLQRALGRTAPARAHLNIVSWRLREQLLPGEQWWADIGHRH